MRRPRVLAPGTTLAELNRRNQESQTSAMLGFTKWITYMTIVITVATLFNVAIATGMLVG